jgi:hypothetical protein
VQLYVEADGSGYGQEADIRRADSSGDFRLEAVTRNSLVDDHDRPIAASELPEMLEAKLMSTTDRQLRGRHATMRT